jgi:hypothetical protein
MQQTCRIQQVQRRVPYEAQNESALVPPQSLKTNTLLPAAAADTCVAPAVLIAAAAVSRHHRKAVTRPTTRSACKVDTERAVSAPTAALLRAKAPRRLQHQLLQH